MGDRLNNNFHDGPFIFRLNDNGTGPSLLIQVCLERGWKGYQPEFADTWNLWWRNGLPAPNRRTLQPWQFMNHIPKGSSICKKDNLARHLKCMKKVYGSIYDFSPPGYHLPLEYAKLAAECSKIKTKNFYKDDDQDENSEIGTKDQKIWICKPVGQSQGRGIYLFRRLSDLNYDSNSVVQRYIERPLLIGGYKFDLRLYVCVPSYHPTTVYIYSEGLARFSTDKFSLNDLHNPFRHLTNSSLNKFGPKYAECKDRIGSGCKWTLGQLRRYLRGVGGRDWRLWHRISALVILTVLAQAPGVPPVSNCFEFFGFDVLVDADLRPWLLEVNLSPALANDCDADEMVKKPLLHDLFDLLGLPMSNTGLSLFTLWTVDHTKNDSDDGSLPDEDNNEDCQRPLTVNKVSARWKERRKSEKSIDSCQNSRGKGGRPSSGNGSVGNRVVAVRSRRQGRPVPAISLTFPTKDQPNEKTSNTENKFMNLEQNEETWNKYNMPSKRKTNLKNMYYGKTSSVVTPWGNGRDWNNPPAKVGGWINLLPLYLPSTDKKDKCKDVRAAVNSVACIVRAAKSIEKRLPEADDEQLNEELKKDLGANIQIWLPQP